MAKKHQKTPIGIKKYYVFYMGNNPMVGATVAVAVAVEQALKHNI